MVGFAHEVFGGQCPPYISESAALLVESLVEVHDLVGKHGPGGERGGVEGGVDLVLADGKELLRVVGVVLVEAEEVLQRRQDDRLLLGRERPGDYAIGDEVDAGL